MNKNKQVSMKSVFTTVSLMVLHGCATQTTQNPHVERVAKNAYRITVNGPAAAGKIALENEVHYAAIELCGLSRYRISSTGFGETIVIKGKSGSVSNEGWHNNPTTELEAVATVSCL